MTAEESLALGRGASLLAGGAMALAGGPLGILFFLAGNLPIWRIPGNTDEGTNFLDYVYQMMYCVEHIPIEQAIEEARDYYLQEMT